ncbi:MAG TPA: hypothetical protein VNQ77_11990 [Frankiaceae bacterium]|nr:hypothetical protein [Frankiaceae bacterium]
MDSKALADLILADLESVVDRTRAAYLARIPRLAEVPPATLDAVLEATRRTMAAFCRYYLEGTLDSDAWRAVRNATVERAGENFSHAEILEIVDIARATGAEAIDRLAERHPELTDEEREKVVTAMSQYVTELAEQEDRLRRLASPHSLDAILGDLEAEGADLQ